MELALLLLSLFLLTSRAQSQQLQQQEAVLDKEGNPLVAGVPYRVLPADNPNGGGLRMARVKGSCPPNVLQAKGIGEPLMFFRGLNPGGVIRLNAGLYILFPRPSTCPQSTLWAVGDEGYITTGGAVSPTNPRSNRFAIEKSGDGAYQIKIYCNICTPTSCTLIFCANVVPKEVEGRQLLGTSLFAGYPVVFERAKEPTATVVADV